MSENSQGEDGQIFNADHWKEVTGYNSAGGDISQTDDQAYQNNPDSCGSMKFVDQVPGQKFELERFDDYFYQPANGYDEDRRPKFAKYITEVVPEAATRIAGLQAGQADMIEANVFLLEDIEAAGGQVVYQPEAAYSWIVFVDCWDPELWCYDKRVRQALEYAINKDAIIDSLYNRDMAIPQGWQHVTPSTIGYRDGVADPRPYDLDMAKQLLEEAGYPGGEGIPPFEIWTWEAGDLPLQPQLAEVFGATWSNDLDLDVTVRTGDATSVRQQWNERKLPGSVLVRTNETRWNGLSITRGMYTYAAGAKAWRICDPVWTSDAHPDGDPVCPAPQRPGHRKASQRGDCGCLGDQLPRGLQRTARGEPRIQPVLRQPALGHGPAHQARKLGTLARRDLQHRHVDHRVQRIAAPLPRM